MIILWTEYCVQRIDSRILYAFDPARAAVLLLGGDKTGDDRWYEFHVPRADALFADYLQEQKR